MEEAVTCALARLGAPVPPTGPDGGRFWTQINPRRQAPGAKLLPQDCPRPQPQFPPRVGPFCAQIRNLILKLDQKLIPQGDAPKIPLRYPPRYP